jgi:hypothetical protein
MNLRKPRHRRVTVDRIIFASNFVIGKYQGTSEKREIRSKASKKNCFFVVLIFE